MLAGRTLSCLLTLCTAAAVLSPADLRGQGTSVQSRGAQTPLPTFQSISQALQNEDYTVEQLRRFRTPNGGVVTVREQLQVDANGTTSPQFALTFLGVEGEPAGSPLSLELSLIHI